MLRLWAILISVIFYCGIISSQNAWISDNDTISQKLSESLSELTVEASSSIPRPEIAIPIATETIGKSFFLKNNSTNFVKTLTEIPGIESMDIGAGFSKPVIRGLGFNRVAVVDRGIVQQNQQWGADHGLEIDQYDVDNVLIHKGPLSLRYGSDAIGGVIEIIPTTAPKNDMLWGDLTLIGKTNNSLLGVSIAANWKKKQWFIKGRFTEQHFSDYRIPTDTVTYLTWKMPTYGGRMKNTAGIERNLSLGANYKSKRFESWINISDVYAKNGFFPGAHGIPDLNRLLPDGSYRDIDMPYSTANHLKVISNNIFLFSKYKMLVDLGYQQNLRREISEFHTHYSNQKLPEIEPNKELEFLLHTATANLRFVLGENSRWVNMFGLASEYQKNTTGGYSFLLPDFSRLSSGAYWITTWKACSHIALSAGLRYDFGNINIKGYYDNTLAEYLVGAGYSMDETEMYAQRAENINRWFGDFSGSIGISHTTFRHSWRINIGKSFRYPSANELASNGVHHGAFRHEKGYPHLRPEKSYQLDAGYEFKTKHLKFSFSPYASYFANYIYLDPSGEWSILPHTGQIYQYKQAKVFMAGSEITATYRFLKGFSAELSGEYLYNLNLTDGYPLPFSVPAKLRFSTEYYSSTNWCLKSYNLKIGFDYVFAQNRIARNEETTPDAFLLNISANGYWSIGRFSFSTDLQIQNIFDVAYLNHLSFYRKLNAPEPGRNIQLIIKIPFGL